MPLNFNKNVYGIIVPEIQYNLANTLFSKNFLYRGASILHCKQCFTILQFGTGEKMNAPGLYYDIVMGWGDIAEIIYCNQKITPITKDILPFFIEADKHPRLFRKKYEHVRF